MAAFEPIVSVTISTFNRCNQLLEVLEALALQSVSKKLFEIIVCDSQSSDNTPEVIAKFSDTHHDLRLRHLHTSNILAAKRNLGVQAATGRLVVFLDDDCVPEKFLVEKYIDLFANTNSEDKVVYCGEVRFPNEWVNRSNYYRFRDSRHFGKKHTLRADYPVLSFKTIVVMNMCFEKKLFLDVIGKVNELFVGYGAEDQELGWRLEESGYKLASCSAKIEHRESSATILGYGDKIFRTARDGMSTLLYVQPNAANKISKLRSLDPLFCNRTTLDYMIYFAVCFFAKLKLHIAIGNLLTWTDHVSIFYSPSIFRFVLAIFYVEGTLDRKNRLTNEKAKLGWG